jgi:opacity protein-like surface antigen
MKRNGLFLSLLVCFLTFNSCGASCLQISDPFNCSQKTGKIGKSYIDLEGGLSFFDLKHETKTDPGYFIGGIFGCPLPYHFRIETEVVYQRARIKSIKEEGIKLNHLGGHLSSWSFMTNILYDFNFNCIVKPFIGGGIGYAQSEECWFYHRSVKHSNFYFEEIHKHQHKMNGFAWQLIAGIAYPICNYLEADIDYTLEKEKIGSIHKIGFSLAYLF